MLCPKCGQGAPAPAAFVPYRCVRCDVEITGGNSECAPLCLKCWWTRERLAQCYPEAH